MYDTLKLINQVVGVDAFGREEITETKREIYCKVDSISQTEFFAAADTELNPEYRFIIFFGDYNGESVCEFGGTRYAIYRTYRDGDDLELYAERKIGA